MSAFSNGTIGGGDPGTVGGDSPRSSVELARSGFRETTDSQPQRMGMPSRVDVANGADEAAWSADPSASESEQHSSSEAASAFGLAKAADALGLSAETVAGARAWLAGETQFTDEQLAQFDREHEAAAVTELRGVWGDQMVANLKTIDAYLETLPGFAGEAFRSVRDANGRVLANDPAALQRMLGAAQARGDTVLSGSLDQQIAAIEHTMRNDRKAYNSDELLQARYRELLALRSRRQ